MPKPGLDIFGQHLRKCHCVHISRNMVSIRLFFEYLGRSAECFHSVTVFGDGVHVTFSSPTISIPPQNSKSHSANSATISAKNPDSAASYGDKWHNGEPTSASFIDSFLNQVRSRRKVKKQLMRATTQRRAGFFTGIAASSEDVASHGSRRQSTQGSLWLMLASPSAAPSRS